MSENARAGAYPAYKIPTAFVWTGRDGCAHRFELPVAYADLLTERLCRVASLAHATLAAKLACLIVAIQPRVNGAGFPLDRRALGLVDHENGRPRHVSEMVKALGFSEWTARIAITLLRTVGFVEQWTQQVQDAWNSTWARWRRVRAFDPKLGRAGNKANLRRAALLYQIGIDFWRAYTSERERSARSALTRAQLDREAEATRATLPDTRLEETSFERLAPSPEEKSAEQSHQVPFMGANGAVGTPGESFFKGKNVLELAFRAARETIPVQHLSNQDMIHRVLEEPSKGADGKPRHRASESLGEALARLGRFVLPPKDGGEP